MKFNEHNAVRLLETLPEALMVISAEGNILFFNQTAEKVTGYKADEVKGQHVTLLLPQSDRRRVDVVSWLQRWALHPDPEQLRYLYLDGLTKEGQKKLYRVRASILPEGDTDKEFAVVFRDITEEHESTVNLRHQQLINNRIMAIGEDAILSIDETGAIRFWNNKAEELFGYKEDEIIGQPLDLLIPQNEKGDHQQQIQRFAAGERPSRLMGERGEIQGRHKSGKLIPLEAAITKTNIDNKMFLSAQIRDISRRKSIEKALRDSEERFRVVFEHAFEAIALLDKEGRVLEINESARDLLPGEEMVGLEFWALDWWPDDTEASALDAAKANLKENINKVLAGDSVRLVVDLSTQGSRSRTIDFSLNPVKDSQGEIIHIIAEGRDITSLDVL